MILANGHNRQWLIKTGRVVIADLLRQDRKDPADFYAAYDRMMDFLNEEGNRQIMMTELATRRVSLRLGASPLAEHYWNFRWKK